MAFDFVVFLDQFSIDVIRFHLFDKQPLLLKDVRIIIHLLRLLKMNKISLFISKSDGLLQSIFLLHNVLSFYHVLFLMYLYHDFVNIYIYTEVFKSVEECSMSFRQSGLEQN